MSFKPDGLQQDEIQENRQKVWDKTLFELDNKADKLGKPIDEGVKESVCAAEVNGFPVYSSCEGHVEKRHKGTVELSPYIGIGFDEPKIRFEGQKQIQGKIAEQFGIKSEDIEENKDASKAFWDYIHRQDVKETPEYLTIRSQNEDFQKAMQIILESFYMNRKSEEANQLVIMRIGACGHFYLTTKRNEAARKVKIIDDGEIEVAKKEIEEEQAEFDRFTQFMKDRYFNS
jgi:hypothetical protein